MIWKFNKRPQSVLGLTLAEGRLRAVHVARSKDGVKVVNSVSSALSLELLEQKPELIGQEIRRLLDAAKIREHACAASVPAPWIMSLHTKIPVLSPEDLDSFLEIEAEKGFPYDVSQLQIARSVHRSASGAYVTQLAVRKDRLEYLSAVLKAARLKPVSFALGLAELPGALAHPGAGRITIALERAAATLLVSAGGGIAAFRTCEASSDAGEHRVDPGEVSRELRVTFEQVPADLRGDIRDISMYGDPNALDELTRSLKDWPDAVGLKIEAAAGDPLEDLVANAAALRWLAPTGSEIEFLPPRLGRCSLLLARYNSKRLATAGLAFGGAVALAVLVFGLQQVRLQILRSEWRGMQTPVASLTKIQDDIREYRPWDYRSFPDLRILARITRCFPDNGSVTARSIDIHHLENGTTVNVTGAARDNRALLRTQDELRKSVEIQGLKVESISGKTPAQFTFGFRWMGGAGS